MTVDHDYDVVVVGAGPGGYVAAISAAQRGARVCLIEKEDLGGVCTNAGCIPTKILIHAAKTMQSLDRAAEFGICAGEPSLDYERLGARRDEVVKKLRGGIESLLSGKDVELMRGAASFVDERTLAIEAGGATQRVNAGKVIIATGSEPAEAPDVPFDHESVLSSRDAVLMNSLPGSVLIVGGGYIGCEFAGLFSAFGVQVTLVEMMDRLLPALDQDCSREALKGLKRNGVKVLTSAAVEGITKQGNRLEARLSGARTATVEKALVCVGRRPVSRGLHIENAGLELAQNGSLTVNKRMQTARPHIYAVGDVNGRALLAHVASHEAVVAASHATGTLTAEMDYRRVPAVVFTWPEIACVGMTEGEANDKGCEITVKKFPFRALGRAHCTGETDGFVKMIADATTGEVLGVHIVGAEAGSLIGEAALAMQLEATAAEIAETIHPHPTMPESLKQVSEGVIGLPIDWMG